MQKCNSLTPHSCSWNNGLCDYKEGSDYCSCGSGWELDRYNSSCVDIDECKRDPCQWSNVLCKNTDGSYICKCKQGWALGEDKASCVDIDECEDTKSPCSGNKICENTNGSFNCACKIGWKWNSEKGLCYDDSTSASICVVKDGVEYCECNDGYKSGLNGSCTRSCNETCDAVKAQCIVEYGNALCKCKVEYGFGTGFASDGDNSCSHYLIGKLSTPLRKGNLIALITEFFEEFFISFDIYPNKFVSGWHSVILFTDGSDIINFGNRVLEILFHESGKGELYISSKANSKCSKGFISNPIGLNEWSKIVISQVFNGSAYNYTIKINNETVFSDNIEQVQRFKNVKVYVSSPSNYSQDGLIKNFYFVHNSSSGIQHVIILPKGFSFERLLILNNTEYLERWEIAGHARQIEKIYGGLEEHQDLQGYWYYSSEDITIVVNTLYKNLNIIVSGVGWSLHYCKIGLLYRSLVRGPHSEKKYIELSAGVWRDFQVTYWIQNGWNQFISSQNILVFYVAILNSCEMGYLNIVNISLADINECTSFNNPCTWKHSVCENTYGSYLCKCEMGWTLDGNSCKDINECKEESPPCSWSNGMCENTIGSYLCKCFSGWKLVGNSCIDIDECNVMTSPCSWEGFLGICENKNGSYSCSYSTESQKNKSFAYTLVDAATSLLEANCVALIPMLNNEHLITFDILFYKFDGWRSVICFSFDFDKCQSSLFNITVDPDNSLVFIKSGKDHFIKFKYPIKLNIWSNIEVSQISTKRIHQYIFTIKVNKEIVYSIVIQSKHEYEKIRVYASDSFYKAQDCLLVKFFFINGKSYSDMYKVFLPSKGTNLEKMWMPIKSIETSWHFREFTQVIEGSIEGNKINNLALVRFSKDYITVMIYPLWLEIPYYNLNFKLSIIAYALQPSSLTIWYMKARLNQLEMMTNVSLFKSSFVTSEEILTFNQYQNFELFGIYIKRHEYGIYLISVNCSMEDVNECDNISQCPWNNSECINTYGSYSCRCKNGWMLGKDKASCEDINECYNVSQCPFANADCENTLGSYVCKCKRGFINGHDNASCIELHNASINYVAIVVPVVVILVVLVVAVAFWIRRSKLKSQSMFLNPEQHPFENYIGYEMISKDKWELLPTSLVFDKKIGQGAFGNVFTAKISSSVLAKTCYASQTGTIDIREVSDVIVAVKLLKDGAIQSEMKDFVEEINLMKGIGYHKNIVNMIGCSTISKPLCLVVEFMENGDLLQFLRDRRTKLIALNMDESSSDIIFTKNYQKSLKKANLLREMNLPETETITPNDLISFAWQVASGMEYLSNIKLVHRDLAARNILVGSEKNVKISDFGLTRKVNDELNYMSCNNRRLPVKWMSIEAIFDQVFTSYSDVWAYGVVLFEIVTLGGTPYPSISNRELLALLKTGYRMDRPDNCSEAMFDHMLRCWNDDPLQRPSFTELRELFEEILSQGGHYFSFEINEESNYYNAASFSSISSDANDGALEKELLKKPVYVNSVEEMEKKIRDVL